MSETRSAQNALSIVGSGRAGGSIASAARRAGIEVEVGGRSIEALKLDGACVLLCVPDASIEEVAGRIAGQGVRPRLIGHVSGATSLGPLLAARATDGCFSMHPLQTLPDGQSDLRGAPAAVSGSSPAAASFADRLSRALGMTPFEVGEADRATYHAAASIASNFLVSLEQSAAGLLESIGVEEPRNVLAPLVRRSLENWVEDGASALTGPIARGDDATVERHREAIGATQPNLLPLYDAMAETTKALVAATSAPAGGRSPVPDGPAAGSGVTA